MSEVKRHSTFGTQPSSDASNSDPNEEGRDRWPSRAAFYLAAVGSAVGFGNVWRFPALAKDYGGGAFFIPYLMALFIVGLPVLILEISLGQYHQTGNVGVFGRFHAKFRGVGMSSIACAYMLVCYYSILLAWTSRAFFESFGDNDPWADEEVTGESAVEYFTNHIIGMETLGDDLRPTRIVPQNVGYAVMVWICVWACLAFGLKWTGRIAYISMGLPIILLFVFLGKAYSLEGASDGIKAYIGEWDMSVLKERPEVWSTAVSQIFFSLSVTFGTMTAYGSHCPRGEPAFANSVVIGFSNSMFSFISGFAVFAAMGHLAYIEETTVDEVAYAGFSLVFGTWPVVFGGLPGGEHWVRLLFFDLFLLGIDSAFSILEGPLTVFLDYSGHTYPKWKMAGIFCVLAFLLSLIYTTDAGLIFLDTVDFYINFVLLVTGFFETFGAGWVYGIEKQIDTLGPKVVASYMFTNFGSIILACCLWFGLDPENSVWIGFIALFVSYFTGIGVTTYLLKQLKQTALPEKEWTWKELWYELGLGNVMDLKNQLSGVVGYMPWMWAFMMKQMIPHILLILFINLCVAENDDGDSLFGHYEGYVAWPFQVLGILCVCFAAILVLIGVAKPEVYFGFDIPAKKELAEAEASAVVESTSEKQDIEKSSRTQGMEKSHRSNSDEDEEEMDMVEEPLSEEIIA